jgi:hypothetical protein
MPSSIAGESGDSGQGNSSDYGANTLAKKDLGEAFQQSKGSNEIPRDRYAPDEYSA